MNVLKKVFALLLAVIIAFAFSIYSSAGSIVTVAGWNLEYMSSTKSYQIKSYEGPLSSPTSFSKYNNIPITSVATYAFYNNKELTSLTLKEPITSIDSYAFYGCSSLKKINLPKTLTTLSYGTFEACDGLQEITLEDTAVTSLPQRCFAYCENLTKVTIPRTVTAIADNAFVGSTKVTIYCYKNSYAHTYAVQKNIPYVLLKDYYILGDADGDMEVTIMDATTVQRVLASIITDTDGKIALRADMARNGLDISDATLIQRFLAQLETPFAIGEKVFED